MILFPEWLVPYCTSYENKKFQTKAIMRCTCGCDKFYIFNRGKTPEEELEEFLANERLENDFWPFGSEIATNKDGQVVARLRFLGITWKERLLADYEPKSRSFEFIAIKCQKCNKEIIIFDQRCNWYKEFIEGFNFSELGPITWSKKYFQVECRFDYSEDYVDGSDFGRVRVFQISLETKKRLKLLDFEM